MEKISRNSHEAAAIANAAARFAALPELSRRVMRAIIESAHSDCDFSETAVDMLPAMVDGVTRAQVSGVIAKLVSAKMIFMDYTFFPDGGGAIFIDSSLVDRKLGGFGSSWAFDPREILK